MINHDKFLVLSFNSLNSSYYGKKIPLDPIWGEDRYIWCYYSEELHFPIRRESARVSQPPSDNHNG